MDARAAALKVLGDAAEEELHWTVIWDRALRGGLIDPMADPGAREAFGKALAEAVRAGEVVKTSKGTYRLGGK